MSTVALKHKGTPLDFPGGTFLVPPLSLAFLEDNMDRLNAFSGSGGDSKLVVDCLHAALARNYPTMTREQVRDMVDLGNMDDVMAAVMKRSGLVSSDEAEASGKTLAAS